MVVKYKKSVGIIFIVVGLLFACLYFVIALGGGETATPLTVGFTMILFGVLTLTRKYFEYDENNLTLHAILGPAKTVYNFNSLKDIELDGKKLYVMQDDTRKKIPVSAGMVNKEDWREFLEKITTK